MPVYFSSNNSLYSIFANGRNIYFLSSHSCRQPKRSTKSNIGCGVMVEWMKATDRHQRANDLSPTINARQIAVIYMVILNIYICVDFTCVLYKTQSLYVFYHIEMSMMVYGAAVYGWLYTKWRIFCCFGHFSCLDETRTAIQSGSRGRLRRQRMLQYYLYVKFVFFCFSQVCGVCWMHGNLSQK